MSIADAILKALQQRPDKVVCRDPDTALTAGQVLHTCRCAAGRYATATGQRVGLLLPNCALYPPALLGALWAGKVPVPLNPLLKSAELDFIFQEAGIDLVVVTEPTRPLVSGLAVKAVDVREFLGDELNSPTDPRPAAPGDVAVLLYTSGTTGRPKGVPLTHDNLLSNATTLIDRFQATSDDVFLSVLPLFHAFGLTALMVGPLLLGAEVVYTRFSPERVATLIARHGVTVFVAVPSMFRLLVRSKVLAAPFQGLRLAVSGGDALPSGVRDAYRQRFGRELLEGYGLTETAPVISVETPQECKPGTVGRVLPGVRVRIQGEDGTLQPPGREGEVQVQGPNVMAGYHNRPDENRAAFTADGWFRTGDLGLLDSDGYLTITGRSKELIVRDGEKVMPREVEDVLERHPKVLDAAVLGEPDGERGQAVVAFVVPADPSVTAEELRQFCRGQLADYKVPRRVVIAADLPRGPTGKILKRALTDWKPAPAEGRPAE